MRIAYMSLSFLILCTLNVNAAEEVKKDPASVAAATSKVVTEKSKPSDFVFDRKDKRRDRDPFYSIVEVLAAEQEIYEYKISLDEETNNTTNKVEAGLKTGPLVQAGAHPTETAIAKARYFADKAEFELLNSNWASAIAESEEGLNVLKTAEVATQFKDQINTLILLLNGFRSTAKDAQLNEAAEAKFNALKLEVQGIMWSADKRSLAIISGEAYFVQDKIGDENDAVTIVNIDPNRVDFMINHQRKRFEFKRYIDN